MYNKPKHKQNLHKTETRHIIMSTIDFKPNLIEWIEEEAITATRRGLKTVDLYNKILKQLRIFPLPIYDLKTLKLIRFIGNKTAEQLRKKVVSHCNEQDIPVPRGFMEVAEKHRIDMEEFTHNLGSATSSSNGPATKKARKSGSTKSKGTAKYIPKQRSGGFAIMIALYLHDRNQNGMTKDQIIKLATPYCDRSFTNNSASKEYYSAWSSINTIIKHELITVTGRSPKIYYLTEEGKILAEQLKNAIGVSSSPATERAGISAIERSFDNGVRFESSFEVSFDGSSPLRILSSSPIRRINNPAHTNKYIQQALNNMNKNTAPESASYSHDAENRRFDGVRYEIWRKEDYDVVLYIDNREIRSDQERDHFQRRLSMMDVSCEVKVLSSGDAIWVAKNRVNGMHAVLNYLCERKRLDDLCDSIKDGRFKEQKTRMKKTGIKHCYYLVEEMITFNDKVNDIIDSIQSSVAQTMTSARLYLRRFRDIDETTAFLASNTRAIESFKSDLIVLKPDDIKNQQNYLDILTKFRSKFEVSKQGYECVHLFSSFQDMMGKTNQMTVKEMYMLMLMTIRGLSLDKAVVLQNRFPTPKSLLEFYHTENSNAPEECKKSLMMNEFKDQVGNKKIGKVLLEKIYEVWGK